MTNSTVVGNRSAQSFATDHQSMEFVISQLLGKVITIVPVRVVALINGGSLTHGAYVNVQPLLNQMTGNQTAVPHGVVYNVPVFRLQGGNNAAIIDPVSGDIGLMVVAYRDSSGLIAADKANPGSLQGGSGTINPGSLAQYDWASGFYLGGWLNGPIGTYIAMGGNAMSIVAPNGVTINGVSIDTHGNISTAGNIASTTGTVSASGSAGDVVVGSGGTAVSLKNHVHAGVTTGGGSTAAPTPGT
jgi:hypothetical protein